jgi:uncharacterized protein
VCAQELVRERVKFGTQSVDDPSNVNELNQVIAMLEPECLMFKADYPHWDGDTPGSVFQALADGAKNQIFHSNAQSMFRW